MNATRMNANRRYAATLLASAADLVRQAMRSGAGADPTSRSLAAAEELRFAFERIRPDISPIAPTDLDPELWARVAAVKAELSPVGGPRAANRNVPFANIAKHRLFALAAEIIAISSALGWSGRAEHSGGTEPRADV
jgi:hypothetical protein